MGEKITGYHAIEEFLREAAPGSTLYVTRGGDKRTGKLESLARSTGKVAIKKVAQIELDRMVPGIDHRGAVLDAGMKKEGQGGRLTAIGVKEFCKSLKEDEGALVLILDGITDPHNLGAILRSCDQFSVGLVVVPERRSVQANETVIRVSSGAARYVPLATVTNLVREIEIFKEHGFWVYGAEMNGTSSYTMKFPRRTALVMGSEGEGLGRLVKESCDELVSIPMSGHIDSLNVSVAAGILLYEVRRQTAQ